MKETLILKIGGSVVTHKNRRTLSVQKSLVEKIGRVLAQAYDRKKYRLILIHGAGSFGHQHAHRYMLAEGTKNHPEKTYRAVENQSLDAQLNTKIASIFVQGGLPVVGMPTRTLAVNTGGELATLETTSLRAALDAGVIPLLHGDMVFDTQWGLSICSGDVLASELAHIFSAKKVFFASDVDGVFSKDPHHYPDAELLKTLSLDEITSGIVRLGVSHNTDVTGGLASKFLRFRNDAYLDHIYLFNGLKPKNFSFLFNQENFFGTRIRVKKQGRG